MDPNSNSSPPESAGSDSADGRKASAATSPNAQASSPSSASIDRREAVKRVAMLLGGAISAPAMTGVLQGCSAGTESGWTPDTLSAHQNDLVVRVSEMIIPATDTPGAEAANVNRFVDKMLTEWFYEEERSHFLSGLDELDAMSEERFGSGFLDAGEADRTALLTELDEEAFAEDVSGGLEEAEDTPFFRTMKELTLLGYYTSEIGMTQELQWMAAPGKYDGCVPLEEVGRTWA